MGKFCSGQELVEAIRKTVARGPADLAVAFWGKGACDRLGLPDDCTGYRIMCDARSGACNPEVLKELINRSASVVDVPRLHAKVYRGPDRVVIASANASSNGLSETDEGLEAGYFTAEEHIAAKVLEWTDNVFKLGKEIHLTHIPDLQILWDRRSRPPREDDRGSHPSDAEPSDAELFTSDQDFHNWAVNNPQSYVINLTARLSPKNIILHRADCRAFTRQYDNTGAFTENDYRKVGARSTSSLIRWIKTNVAGADGFTHCCRTCSPEV